MSPTSTNPKAPARATNILHAHGHTLNDTRHMTDAELLALPGFGKSCLDYVRAFGRTHVVGESHSTKYQPVTGMADDTTITITPKPKPKPKRGWRRLWHKATT
jgi:hypothetical protein